MMKNVLYCSVIESKVCIAMYLFVLASYIVFGSFVEFDKTDDWKRVIFCFIAMICTLSLSFMINVQILKFELKSRFLLYWRVADIIFMYLAIVFVWFQVASVYENSNWQAWLITAMELIIIIVSTAGITMAKAYVTMTNGFKMLLVTLAVISIAVNTYSTLASVDDDTQVTWSCKLFGSFSARLIFSDIVAFKGADAIVWNLWQFWEMLKFPNQLRMNNVHCKWVLRVRD